ITRDASFRARDAFISPSAAITCRRKRRRRAFISQELKHQRFLNNRYQNCRGSFTSLISTRSTLIPQSSVASSRVDWRQRDGHTL
uniref:Uncharacterized protein n=1 Tax=Poecilia reticulata TaxID=8081 RepID=A0A3P9QD92_POERE